MSDDIDKFARDSKQATREMLEAIGARWGAEAEAKAYLYVCAYLSLAQSVALSSSLSGEAETKEQLFGYMKELSHDLLKMLAVMVHPHGRDIEDTKRLIDATLAAAKRPVSDMNRAIRES